MSHSGGEKIAPATRSTTTGEEEGIAPTPTTSGEKETPVSQRATIFATSGVYWPEPSKPPADSDSDFSRGS